MTNFQPIPRYFFWYWGFDNGPVFSHLFLGFFWIAYCWCECDDHHQRWYRRFSIGLNRD